MDADMLTYVTHGLTKMGHAHFLSESVLSIPPEPLASIVAAAWLEPPEKVPSRNVWAIHGQSHWRITHIAFFDEPVRDVGHQQGLGTPFSNRIIGGEFGRASHFESINSQLKTSSFVLGGKACSLYSRTEPRTGVDWSYRSVLSKVRTQEPEGKRTRLSTKPQKPGEENKRGRKKDKVIAKVRVKVKVKVRHLKKAKVS
jgi:hypothetical protein